MATFDQRGQNVNYQYNAAGDINFNGVQNKDDLAQELKKLLGEVTKATQAGAIKDEVAVDVESNLRKAVIQAEKPEPDKKSILNYLNDAKGLVAGLTSATGLVGGLVQAIQLVGRMF
jgi:hypothetical protein